MREQIAIKTLHRTPSRGVSQETVDGLAHSILEIGLLNPILVDGDRNVVAGEHRIRAFEKLRKTTGDTRWERIPSLLVSLNEMQTQLATIDENLVRNEGTTLERSKALKRRKELYEALHPETRHGGDRASGQSGHLPSFSDDTASKTGASARSVRRHVQVAENLDPKAEEAIRTTPAADSITELEKIVQLEPKKQRKVATKLKTGKARSVREAVRQVKREELAGKGVELPSGPKRYRVIYADPPWQYNDQRAFDAYSSTAAEHHYPTMSVEELSALDVRSKAAEDAVLFCWATFPLLTDALEVVKAWGFTYKTAFVWSKGRGNFGHYHDASAELLLVCTRGSGVPDSDTREPQVKHVELSKADRKHSRKPEDFRAMIERLYQHGARLELFRRGEAPKGWDVFGNEARQERGDA